MQHHGERRATGVRRIPVERIVDVCPTGSASGAGFQGWSLNVSGRGMSVRATHVPELEAPVVLRFQEHGSEVIAEAVVVWRRTVDAGSEFGVRFTALDSSSVQALKALCLTQPLPQPTEAASGDEEYDTEPAPLAQTMPLGSVKSPAPASVKSPAPASVSVKSPAPASVKSKSPAPASVKSPALRSSASSATRAPAPSVTSAGQSSASLSARSSAPSSVKLHIEGMAAPMQARVRQQGSRQVALASPLEFLRVGRDVDVEDAAPGGRRRARIDRVDVDVDPDSQVPELVVSLRYDATSKPPRVRTVPMPPAKSSLSHDLPLDSDDPDVDDEAADLEAADAGRAPSERVDGESPALKATVRPVRSARSSERELDDSSAGHDGPSLEIEEEGEGDGLSDAERLRRRLDGMLDGLSTAARAARQRALHVGDAATRGARWLVARAEDARRSALAAQRVLPRRRTTSAPRSLRAFAPRSQTPKAGDTASRRLPPRRAVAVGAMVLTAAAATWLGRASTPAEARPTIPAAAAPAARPASPAPVIIEEIPTPAGERPRLLVPPDDGEPADVAEPQGVVAQVPLFGPTSLDPAPARGGAPAASRATPSRSVPERRALARVEANGDAFQAPAPSSRSKAKSGAEFTSGRLQLPTVHRLRLDEPGAGLRGERTPTGFDVIIPGRKTMESGTAIARRDARIAKVTTKNGSEGARISFRFRSDIPAYKVRLRNDFVEFFISAP